MKMPRPVEQRAQQQQGHQGHPDSKAHQCLAALHGECHREDRQHERNDRDDPLALHDQVEQPRELRDLLLRHDRETQTLRRDSLDRVEERHAVGVGIVNEVVERRRQVERDLAPLFEFLLQRGLLAGEDVHHGLVAVSVERVPQFAELRAREDLERQVVHIGVHLVHDRRDERLRRLRERMADLVLHDVRRKRARRSPSSPDRSQ